MSKNTEKTAQVYRFHDTVAFHTENSSTMYLTPEVAQKLGKALIAFANDCKTQTKFSLSTLPTTMIKE